MIKAHFETVTKQERIVDDIVCNSCGKPIKVGNHDYLHIYKEWGYNANHEHDEQDLDICEDCCYKILGTFKIPVPEKTYDAYGDYGETIAHKDEYNTDVNLKQWRELHK